MGFWNHVRLIFARGVVVACPMTMHHSKQDLENLEALRRRKQTESFRTTRETNCLHLKVSYSFLSSMYTFIPIRALLVVWSQAPIRTVRLLCSLALIQ
jgi:hypothetical protein